MGLNFGILNYGKFSKGSSFKGLSPGFRPGLSNPDCVGNIFSNLEVIYKIYILQE